MDLAEFLEKQNNIYNRIRNEDMSNIKKTGTKPTVIESFGGYLIVLRHPKDIAETVEKFAKRINDFVPSIIYGVNEIHTTISDYKLGEKFIPDKNILQKLTNAVYRVRKNSPFFSSSEDWLYSPSTVIVARNPDESFLQIAKETIAEAEKEGIQLKCPWGAHITTNRFTKTRIPEELKDFFKLMKEAPLIKAGKAEFLDVGYYNYIHESLDMRVYDRIKLPK